MNRRLLVLISGSGSNLHNIIKATSTKILNANIVGVISNHADVTGVNIAQNAKLPLTIHEYDRENMSRKEYDMKLVEIVNSYEYDVVVLAGWMHILSGKTLNSIKHPIINLHPALPNTFTGANAIEQTLNAYHKNSSIKAGLMTHYVIPEVDKGEPIMSKEVSIYNTDTIDSLTERIKYYEKSILLESIEKVLNTDVLVDNSFYKNLYHGKVRECWDVGYNVLAMYQSNRQSAFDRAICDIPNKGKVLTQLSKYWFDNTRHIIPNHLLYTNESLSLTRKCNVFQVEVVVRSYMTGSTSTSLWTNYKRYMDENKESNYFKYCGNTFKRGICKNEKLDKLYITPTTKGIRDELITPSEIIQNKLMTKHEWEYVSKKALELFEFGQKIAEEKGYILVDTKYEFGRDCQTNEILLVDEIHTCDSSRYWRKDTYKKLFNNNKEPEKLDKDLIRDYIKKKCDPYKDQIPIVPDELINMVDETYINFANDFVKVTPVSKTYTYKSKILEKTVINYFNKYHNQMVIIIAGSTSDKWFTDKIAKELNKQEIYSQVYFSSAHKEPHKVLGLLKSLEMYRNSKQIVIATVAGRSNALSGVCGANSTYPVYAIPPFKDKTDLQVNLASSIMMPSSTPVSLILEPSNFALQCKKMFEAGAHFMLRY